MFNNISPIIFAFNNLHLHTKLFLIMKHKIKSDLQFFNFVMQFTLDLIPLYLLLLLLQTTFFQFLVLLSTEQ